LVRVLLDAGLASDLWDASRRTPLHIASMHGHAAVAQVLCLAECAVDAQDVLGRSALIEACAADHASVVAALLDAGAAVVLDRASALHEAARRRSSQTFALVMEHVARTGHTPRGGCLLDDRGLSVLAACCVAGFSDGVSGVLALLRQNPGLEELFGAPPLQCRIARSLYRLSAPTEPRVVDLEADGAAAGDEVLARAAHLAAAFGHTACLIATLRYDPVLATMQCVPRQSACHWSGSHRRSDQGR
jgi:hypothetical protein